MKNEKFHSKVLRSIIFTLQVGLLVGSCALPSPPEPLEDLIDELDPNSSRLDVPFLMQRKDTHMLCLNGDPEDGTFAWDRPHNAPPQEGPHGGYCARIYYHAQPELQRVDQSGSGLILRT